jgi:hypothetical protein
MRACNTLGTPLRRILYATVYSPSPDSLLRPMQTLRLKVKTHLKEDEHEKVMKVVRVSDDLIYGALLTVDVSARGSTWL